MLHKRAVLFMCLGSSAATWKIENQVKKKHPGLGGQIPTESHFPSLHTTRIMETCVHIKKKYTNLENACCHVLTELKTLEESTHYTLLSVTFVLVG